MFADEVPDLTVPELLDNDEDDEYSMSEEDIEEMEEHHEDLWKMSRYTQMAVTLGSLLMEGHITFREYIEYIEWVEDLADEDGVTLP